MRIDRATPRAQGSSGIVPTAAPRVSPARARSAAAGLLLAGLVACGGGGETAAVPPPPPPPAPAPAPTPTPTPPPAPTLDAVETDNIVSVAEASDGVSINGGAQPSATVSINWGGAGKQASVAADGRWSVSYAAGEVPAAGTTLLTVVASNADGSSPVTQRQIVVEAAPTGPVTFMALGDSMLKGDENNTLGALQCTSVTPNTSWRSFRGNLQQRLSNAGYLHQWVGSQTLTPASGGNDPDHEGYQGVFIGPIEPGDAVRGTPTEQADCRTRSTTPTGDGNGNGNLIDRLPGILTGADPDVIVFFGGWNSVYCDSAQNPSDSSTSADKLTQLVDQIETLKPATKVLLTTLTPQRGQTEAQTNASVAGYAQLNQRMRDLAAARANVYVADLAALSLNSADYWDIIHWCQPAADQVGQAIFNAIEANDLMVP